MGKHLFTREERISKARLKRKHMNKKHHLQDKVAKRREDQIMAGMKIKLVDRCS
jgi:hypothetical protein